MTEITSKAKKLARRLRSEYRQIRSWRKLTAVYNHPLIKPRTLNRIAISLKREGVQWYPKDERILTALGLIKPRKPRTSRRLEDLTNEELTARRARLVKQITHIQSIIASRTS